MRFISPRFHLLIACGTGVLVGIALMTAATVWPLRSQDAPAYTGIVTVSHLTGMCRGCNPGEADHSACGFCRGMVSGVVDSLNDGVTLCVGDGWSNLQGMKLFLAWAERHTDTASLPAAEGIARAHAAGFACKSKRGHRI